MIGVDQKPALEELHPLAEVAPEMIRDGYVVGLGTGHAASAFVEALGGRVREGLRVRGVPTSRDTAQMALGWGIPLVSLDGVEAIDVTIDGADEVEPQLDLITDNGNYVLDCQLAAPQDPIDLEQSLRAIPGVVGTGLFLGMADTVLVQDGDRVEVRQRQSG